MKIENENGKHHQQRAKKNSIFTLPFTLLSRGEEAKKNIHYLT